VAFIVNLEAHSTILSDLIRWLNPIPDASHTRNRKRSPPDSECFPGTREEPICEVIVWADCGEIVSRCFTTRNCT
jgi:hypothetical protein